MEKDTVQNKDKVPFIAYVIVFLGIVFQILIACHVITLSSPQICGC